MVIVISTIVSSVAALTLLIQQKVVTLGIPKYKQMKEHKGKEWKHEEAIIPLEVGNGVTAKVESEVKWCPETNEIFRKKRNVGVFEEDWQEITRYSNLYKTLLQNFKNKYVKNRGNKNNEVAKTDWNTLS